MIFDLARLHRLAETVDERLLTAMQDDVDGSDPLTIVYTSGTTTAPKGVVHTHAALLNHQRNLNTIRGLTAADRLFCNSPFFWIGGLGFALLATLLAGSTLVCSNAEDAGQTLDLLEAERPTITNGFAAASQHTWCGTRLSADATFRRCDAATCTRSWLLRYDRPTPNCGTTCSG